MATAQLGLSGGTMNQKERFESFMGLARFAFDGWNARRQYEWKVTLGLWALLAAAIAKKGDLHLEQLGFWRSLAVGLAVILVYAFLWLRPVWAANERDKRITFYFRDAADQVLRNPAHVPAQTADERQKLSWCTLWFGFLGTWVTWFDLAVTCLMLLLFWLAPAIATTSTAK